MPATAGNCGRLPCWASGARRVAPSNAGREPVGLRAVTGDLHVHWSGTSIGVSGAIPLPKAAVGGLMRGPALWLSGEIYGARASRGGPSRRGGLYLQRRRDPHELQTGRPPFLFCAATVAETLAQLIEQQPTPPRQMRPTIPLDLELICLKCLEKRPENRYATAALAPAEHRLHRERLLRHGVRARPGARVREARRRPRGARRPARLRAARRRPRDLRGPRERRSRRRRHGRPARPCLVRGGHAEDSPSRGGRSFHKLGLDAVEIETGVPSSGRCGICSPGAPGGSADERPRRAAVGACGDRSPRAARALRRGECVETAPPVPSGRRLIDAFPERGTSGYSATLHVVVSHGHGETVLPRGLELQSESDTARAPEGRRLRASRSGRRRRRAPVEHRHRRQDRPASDDARPALLALPREPGRHTLVAALAAGRPSPARITTSSRSARSRTLSWSRIRPRRPRTLSRGPTRRRGTQREEWVALEQGLDWGGARRRSSGACWPLSSDRW